MTTYLRIVNWGSYQHYKRRSPPWIKLHRDLLTSRTWVSLDDASRVLAIASMLLAAEHDNEIPADPAYIQRRAYLHGRPDFAPLIAVGFLEVVEKTEGASKVLAHASNMHTNATPETEVETETEAEPKGTFTSDEVPWETPSETPTQPPALQDLPLALTPPTVTEPTPEVELFRRGKEVLGANAGGMIRKLLAFHGEVVALARASIELASTKENPREWIGGLLRKGSNEEADREAARRARHTFN